MNDLALWIVLAMGIGYAILGTVWYIMSRPEKLSSQLARTAMQALGNKYFELDFEYENEQDAVRDALKRNNIDLLTAYANLIGEVDSTSISPAVHSLAYAKLTGTAGELTVDSLTAGHINAFFRVSMASDHRKRSVVTSEANKIGFFAMKNLDDVPLILSIVTDRGVSKLSDVEQVLAEMKSSPSSSLAEGVL